MKVSLPIEVPSGKYCSGLDGEKQKSMCRYLDDERGHSRCNFDFGFLQYTKEGDVLKAHACAKLKEIK